MYAILTAKLATGLPANNGPSVTTIDGDVFINVEVSTRVESLPRPPESNLC
jgi:hypothetical protein